MRVMVMTLATTPTNVDADGDVVLEDSMDGDGDGVTGDNR
eukprot:CAMPEP_0194381602 /NCGR_PEP_ID=MMETSP0174-20130528/54317_1 /TAXON_ID=216777 /ORGANISM="Proboscia alata, Strain PI-D3" /LENGTH=39 /DNA_ID= /DNA_START= /DNA_END= /DNA_ORIENTATION=